MRYTKGSKQISPSVEQSPPVLHYTWATQSPPTGIQLKSFLTVQLQRATFQVKFLSAPSLFSLALFGLDPLCQ